jgi:class 3 adenylate cyclase
MENGTSLAAVLTERGLRPDAVVRATRYYLAERLNDPATGDLREDLAERVADGAELTGLVAGNAQLLRSAALGVLSAAWEQPGERERIVRALDEHGGNLPAADLLPVAATVVYGLFLLARTGHMTDESTTVNRDGTYEHRRIERRGALAILLGALAKAPAQAGASKEGNFTVVQVDIQGSGQMSEADQARATIGLRDLLSASLADVSVGHFDINDKGDGWQVLIPDAAGGLTPIVSGLPRLVRKRLTDVPVPGLRVRMGIHCGRLRFEQRWTGGPLVHLARIIDDQRLKTRLEESDKRLLTVISDQAHQETVIAGYAEAAFESATIVVKETTAKVWFTMS